MNAVSALNPSATGDGLGSNPVAAPLATLRLRVLSGRSEGAEHRLPPQRRIAIGHSFENDIVLRDASTKGCAIELATGARRPLLKVVAGEVVVLGRALGPGETIQVEPYLPIAIGAVRFALGGDDEARWTDAQGAVADTEAADAAELDLYAPTDLAERIELRTRPTRERFGRFGLGPRWLAGAGAVLIAMAAGTHYGSTMLDNFGDDPARIEAGLRAAGYPTLVVEPAADGRTQVISGLVADAGQLAQLREWVTANHAGALVDVDTLDAVAAAAEDMLTAQGIDAVARAEGANALVIEGQFLPQDRQRELRDLLRRDLPRIEQVTFRRDPARDGESDLAYFFNAPGYGAASFVDGDPGYLVTEDGTRWFAGAALPTGHRIVEIAQGSLTVEREGMLDKIVM